MASVYYVKQFMDELEEVALPLKKWLEENGTPHTTIIIDKDGIKVVDDTMFIPFKKDE